MSIRNTMRAVALVQGAAGCALLAVVKVESASDLIVCFIAAWALWVGRATWVKARSM